MVCCHVGMSNPIPSIKVLKTCTFAKPSLSSNQLTFTTQHNHTPNSTIPSERNPNKEKRKTHFQVAFDEEMTTFVKGLESLERLFDFGRDIG